MKNLGFGTLRGRLKKTWRSTLKEMWKERTYNNLIIIGNNKTLLADSVVQKKNKNLVQKAKSNLQIHNIKKYRYLYPLPNT